jgi:hypothetical protein
MEIILSGMRRRKHLVQNVFAWNLGKPGGWEEYEKLTDIHVNEI